MKLIGNRNEVPPVVTLVNEIKAGLRNDIPLSFQLRDLLTNQGKQGRIEAVLSWDLPAEVSLALAIDPSSRVKRSFVTSDSAPEKYNRHFDACYPPGLMELLWPSLSRAQQEMVIQARVQSRRAKASGQKASALYAYMFYRNSWVDLTPVLSWDVGRWPVLRAPSTAPWDD